MMETYEKMFGAKPKKYTSPLEKNDHPKLDTTPLLDEEDITKFQSMVGAAQWLVTLARFVSIILSPLESMQLIQL